MSKWITRGTNKKIVRRSATPGVSLHELSTGDTFVLPKTPHDEIYQKLNIDKNTRFISASRLPKGPKCAVVNLKTGYVSWPADTTEVYPIHMSVEYFPAKQ